MAERWKRMGAAAIVSLSLAACTTGASKSDIGLRTPTPAPPSAAAPAPRSAQPRLVLKDRDPSAILGTQASALTERFGIARLTLPEGEATKLQFASPTCVLDIYLYPLAAGAEPIATHVLSRRRDGSAIEQSACVAALERER